MQYAKLNLAHTSDISISTISIRKQSMTVLLWDLRRQNNDNFSLFRLLFCSWLMLGLCSYACAYDDVAGLTSFLCFALMLMLLCEPSLTNPLRIYVKRDSVIVV